MKKARKYDAVIIGGGFYGVAIALFLKRHFGKIAIIEKEKDILLKASYVNQARIHNGYHYPRSALTAIRSHLNYEKFLEDYKPSVYSKFKQYYAIAKISSKTTTGQFVNFCKQVNIPLNQASDEIKNFFNPLLVDDVFETEEVVYDADILRKTLIKSISKEKITLVLDSPVRKIKPVKDGGVLCVCDKKTFVSRSVFNCTYSKINEILVNSNLPTIALKDEFVEMPIIKVPKELTGIGVTIMDGPYFGFLPFPAKKAHSLWHVRYALHSNFADRKSSYPFMYRDMKRFIPALAGSRYLESLYEVKTVLVDREESDGRPILFKKDYGFPGFHVVMGSKIDNIYDVLEKIRGEIVI